MKASIIALFAGLSLFGQQPPSKPPQPPGPSPEERRILLEEERRREAEERQRLDDQLRRLEDLDNRVQLPPSPEEIEARRRKRLPHFKRDLEGFRVASTQISSHATGASLDTKSVKEVRKTAKTLEQYIDGIVDYLMNGEEPPEPVPSDDTATLEERISLLKSIAGPMHQRIRVRSSSPLVDVNAEVALIQDLQNLKSLVHSLRK